MDPSIRSVVAASKLPYVLMHMRGTPQTMQSMMDYTDVTTCVKDYFEKQISSCREIGINQLVIDPGFGFAKTIEQNFQLLRNLASLHELSVPLLVGLSRKSMIYKTLEVDPLMALNGTTALHMHALMQGASILRVHDVRAAWEAIRLFQAIQES